MEEQKVTYKELAARLGARGYEEDERNLANKVARGELSAAIFLLCLQELGCEALQVAPSDPMRPRVMSIDDALGETYITLVERDDLAGVYRLRVGELATVVTITLHQRGSFTRFRNSHIMKPPIDYPFEVERVDRLPAASLSRAISFLVRPYRAAIDAELIPDETWLEPRNPTRTLPNEVSR